MRKFISGLIAGLLVGLLLSGSVAFAGSPIKLVINGKQVFCDSPPQIINGRVMVPARNVAESLGATVSWDAANKTVIVNSIGNTPSQQPSSKDAEKTEFLKISAEADALIAKYEAKLEGSISESECDAIKAEFKAMGTKLHTWGQLSQYTTVKNLYIDALEYLHKACMNKAFVNDKYVGKEAKDSLDTNYHNFTIKKNQITGEKTRLQKLGY